MIAVMKPLSIFFAAALLAGCGGGDNFDTAAYQNAVGAAVTKEAEARTLGVDTPCNSVLQCGTLVFTDPKNQCAMPVYQPYSLASATAAAAKLASDQQLALAAHARELSSQPLIPCPAYIGLPPVLACVASRCITSPGSTPL